MGTMTNRRILAIRLTAFAMRKLNLILKRLDLALIWLTRVLKRLATIIRRHGDRMNKH